MFDHPNRIRATLLAGLLLALAGTVAPAQARAGQTAYLRAAHFSPDTANVDVYLTSFGGGTTTLWLSNVGYGAVSPYRPLTAGVYAVAMRPHGASRSTPPVLSWTLHAQAGAAYTAAGVGINKHLHAVILHDQLHNPSPGEARVRVIQAASRAPVVDVRALHGPTVATAAHFGTTTGYATVPSGTWHVQVKSANSSLTAEKKVSLRPGSISSVVVLDAKQGSGLNIETTLDASGTGTVPTGAVPAGGGGTAARPWQLSVSAPLLIAGALLVVLTTATMVRRRARP